MVRFLISLCISWSVSSWILTETLFFFPSLERVVGVAEQWLTIPRHDEWDINRVKKERIALRNATSYHLPEIAREEASSSDGMVSPEKSVFELFFVEHPFTIHSIEFQSFRAPSGEFWWS
jgi:hypothetical protein